MNKDRENIFLLKLLEDPDIEVYNILKDQILDNHVYFKPFLEGFHVITEDKLAINRSDLLLDEINYIEFKTRLLDYASQSKHSLCQGVFLLETFFNKDLKTEEIETEFDIIFKEIWIELNYTLTNIEKVKVINNVLFKKIGFKQIKGENVRPKDLSIFDSIRTKTFIAPTIALLYCMISERLKLPIYMLNIPGIFVTGYFDNEISKIIGSKNDIALYIHPYDNGAILGDKIINKYFKDNNFNIDIAQISNLSNIEFLLFFFKLKVNIIKEIKPNRINNEQTKQIDSILKRLK